MCHLLLFLYINKSFIIVGVSFFLGSFLYGCNERLKWNFFDTVKAQYVHILIMAMTKNSKKFKWGLDFSLPRKSERVLENVLSPPGYNPIAIQVNNETARQIDPMLVIKKSWDLALGPLKQLPMNLFVMYMAGNSISIFPIMMVAFKMIEGSHAAIQKLVYFIGNLLSLALVLYKCQSMGLLPTHSSDWLAFVQPQKRMEFNGGGMSL